MTAKGHVILASTLAYLPIGYITNSYSSLEAIVSYIAIVFGSLLPDIDEPNSYIGRKMFYLSHLLRFIGLQHKTFTHWLITPLIIGSIGYFIEEATLSLVVVSIAFGILAHDIGDMLANRGIKGFLFPFFRNTRIVLLPNVLRLETFSSVEMFVNFLLALLNVFLYSKYFPQVN